MRTLDDLRRSFEQHADLAGPPQGLIQAAQEGAARIRRRRRLVRAGVSAAVVAVLVVTVPVVMTRSLAKQPAPATPASPAGRQFGQVTVDLDPASHYAIGTVIVGETRQELTAGPVGPRSRPQKDLDPSLHVVVFDPGTFHTGSLPGTEPVTVAGHDAWFQPAFPISELRDTPPDDARGPAVGWTDGFGAQVVVYRRSVSDSQKALLLRDAESVRIGPPRDLIVPFRVGWVPAGMAITGITQRSGGPDTIVTLRRDDAEVRIWATPNLSASSAAFSGSERTELTVAGRPAFYSDEARNSSLVVPKVGSCGLIIETADQEPTTRADFVRILENLAVADCQDRTTWTPLNR